MDGGGYSGQGGLVNRPPADYDSRTDGFYNGGVQPDMPLEHYEGSGLDNANPDDDDPHSRGAQPDMPQDEFGNSGNSGEATCPHKRSAQPDMPQSVIMKAAELLLTAPSLSPRAMARYSPEAYSARSLNSMLKQWKSNPENTLTGIPVSTKTYPRKEAQAPPQAGPLPF